MNEYITKSAALAVFGDIHPLDYNTIAYAEKIKAIPAADVVEVRHGFWWPGYEVQNCSICSYRGKRSYKFCPSCGAKMDGGQDDV